jgi:iron-sulfur cluster insertion protein
MSQATDAYVYPTNISESDIQVKPAAGSKLAELLAGADPGFEVVRLFVSGGGCGGMTYGMTFSEGASEYDSLLVGDGFKLAVDAVALNFLRGAEIDFANNSFVFNKVFQSVGGSGTCGGCGGGKGF